MDLHGDFLKRFLQCETELRALIGSVIRDISVREDVFQEVALTLWQHFERYDPNRPFGAWARGIAVKKLLERWHQARRTPVPFSPRAIQMLAEAAEQAQEQPPLSFEALDHCLERLPEKARRLLALRYRQSRKLEAIATEFQTTTTAIYQALSRLRSRLRECMLQWLAARGVS